ncbi:hypothetical protein BDAP_001252 [Binucleata daphniae]
MSLHKTATANPEVFLQLYKQTSHTNDGENYNPQKHESFVKFLSEKINTHCYKCLEKIKSREIGIACKYNSKQIFDIAGEITNMKKTITDLMIQLSISINIDFETWYKQLKIQNNNPFMFYNNDLYNLCKIYQYTMDFACTTHIRVTVNNLNNIYNSIEQEIIINDMLKAIKQDLLNITLIFTINLEDYIPYRNNQDLYKNTINNFYDAAENVTSEKQNTQNDYINKPTQFNYDKTLIKKNLQISHKLFDEYHYHLCVNKDGNEQFDKSTYDIRHIKAFKMCFDLTLDNLEKFKQKFEANKASNVLKLETSYDKAVVNLYGDIFLILFCTMKSYIKMLKGQILQYEKNPQDRSKYMINIKSNFNIFRDYFIATYNTYFKETGVIDYKK